jgi:hypothetical protein
MGFAEEIREVTASYATTKKSRACAASGRER